MLTLPDWLHLAGFQRGNPFALKEADSELDLPAYFVAHQSYGYMLDPDHLPYSGVLHAPRGAGKSTMRRMFETFHQRTHPQQSLILSITNWDTVYQQRSTASFSGALPHLQALSAKFLATLAEQEEPPTLQDPELAGYFAELVHASERLRPTQYIRLEQVTQQHSKLKLYSMLHLSLVEQLQILAEIIQDLGYKDCYILIDRLDELPETAGSPEAASDLIAPLIGNLPANEIRTLAFRYYLPTEVLETLRLRGILREDRLHMTALSWNSEQLAEMLRQRLRYYSNESVLSLGHIAVLDLRDEIDRRVVEAAHGSPRHLLSLGEALFRACATAADHEDWQITRSQLEMIVMGFSDKNPISSLMSDKPATALTVLEEVHEPFEQASADQNEPAIPPLRIIGAKVLKGNSEVPSWAALPKLQRILLQYVYDHHDTLCEKDKLIDAVYGSSVSSVDEDNLRKLVDRLIKWLEDDPNNPKYLKKVSGGGLMLVNAGE